MKFAFIGLLATFLNFCVYSIIYHLTLKIKLASVIGYFSGLLITFYYSNSWTFTKARYQNLSYSLLLFIFIYFMGGLEMTLIINIVDKLIQNHRIAWICGAFVAAMNNYVGSKYLLFHD